MTSAGPDPVTVEIVTHRLHEITREIATTLERVGGTVNTAQMEDYIAALYRRDGALVSAGERASWHTYCAGQAVRAVIARFGDDIRPGDMYLLNDPYTAAIHQSDMYLVSPVHAGDGGTELVGWSATFVHVMDVGARSPGGNSPAAREVEHEGLRFGALRIVDAGTLRTDVVDLLVRMTRQPEMVGLDLRCQTAANHVARERVVQLHRRYGGDVVEAVHRANLGTSRRVLEERLSELPDVELSESADVLLTPGEPVRFACMLRKHGATIEFDFTGSSDQARLGINLPRQATFGACSQAVFDTLARDLDKNEGLFEPIVLTTRPGSVVACTYPAPVSLNTTSGGAAAKFVAQALVAELAAMSTRWRRAARPRALGRRASRHAGRTRAGEPYVSTIHSLNGGSPSPAGDGTDCSRGETTSHNVEWLEANFPLLQCYRRILPDTGGAGTFRGGAAEATAYVPHRAPGGTVRLVAHGLLGNATAGRGAFGGLPGGPSQSVVRRFRDAAAEVADGPGTTVRVPWYEELVLGPDDLLVLHSAGGPGLGDPVDRAPAAVVRDLRLRRVTPEAAELVYGVVVAGGRLDPAATGARRAAIREERRRAATESGFPGLVRDGGDGGGCAHDRTAVRAARARGGLAVFQQPAPALGWRGAEGHLAPTFEVTCCPSCWGLVDVRPLVPAGAPS